ncbi:MAG: IS1595 family transposase [Desulfobulbaceae bacterium]
MEGIGLDRQAAGKKGYAGLDAHQQEIDQNGQPGCFFPMSPSFINRLNFHDSLLLLIGRAGRGATGKIPFVAAVSTNDQGHPINMRFTRVPSFSLQAIGDWAACHLAPGCLVVSDGLGCFSAIKQAGHDHTVIITGGGPESVKIPEFNWVNTIIGNVKNALHGTFHAISEKHFHRYLAEFCYRFNRRFDLRQMIPRFGYVAVRTPPVTSHMLKSAEFHW